MTGLKNPEIGAKTEKCPFCNEPPMGAFPDQSRPAPWWRVACHCGASGPAGMGIGSAFDKWNRQLTRSKP